MGKAIRRNVFGPNSDDKRRHWMKLHNEEKERNDLYSSPDITEMIK
jgi:hypothetical protein